MSGTVIVTLIVGLLVFMFLGMPIAWAMLSASLLTVLVDGSIPLVSIAQKFFVSCDVFALLAVPAFILSGDLMTEGGVSKRLIGFTRALVGKRQGGLANVALIASAFFAAISGSAPATTSAIGGMTIPEMQKEGYPDEYSASIAAIGGTLGIIIPPSISFVVYGNCTGVSVGKLLMAGVIPGIISCAALCFVSSRQARKMHLPAGRQYSGKEKWTMFLHAFAAILMPVIILGGIYSGLCTPTESAVISVFYGLIVGILVYKELNGKKLINCLAKSAATCANIMIIVGAAMIFNYLLTYYGISAAVTQFVITISGSKTVFLLLTIVLLLIVGMFMDTTASILILGPMLAPVAVNFGIDPVQYGMLFVFLMALGLATPPFGLCMYIGAGIADTSVVGVAKRLMPFIIVQLILALLFAFVPFFSTLLPSIVT